MRVLIILIISFICITLASSDSSVRIVGGATTTIEQYPAIAAVLQAQDLVNYRQVCGSSVLNERAVLTAAHCFMFSPAPAASRVRVGSTWANSGGAVHQVLHILEHPAWSPSTLDSDVAILHLTPFITFTPVVRAALIAGPSYVVPDYDVVWAAGWGATVSGGPFSEELRHVQIMSVSRSVCAGQLPGFFTDNMMCAGVPGAGGQNTCTGDSGGPLYHHGVVVGITSFSGMPCASPTLHSGYALVSRFTPWIITNA